MTIFRKFLRTYATLPRSHYEHVTKVGDFAEILPTLAGKVSVVYADPPYTRDHYSRFYHVLETLALGDEPQIAMSNLGGGAFLSRGFYRLDRHQSDFCIVSKAPDAFSVLFREVAKLRVPLVLSYSGFDESRGARPRVVSIRTVRELAERYFSSVHMDTVREVEHNKLNAAVLNKGPGTTVEVLFRCEVA
jgi:adenine-specific DNA methylase